MRDRGVQNHTQNPGEKQRDETVNILSPEDVLQEAKFWDYRMNRKQARSLLRKNAEKIQQAMAAAAKEVLKEEVAGLVLAHEEKEFS